MNRPAVFRQVALHRLSSPDDVDRLLRVTSPRGWIALVGFAVLIVTATVWAFKAAVPLTVRGQGILLKSGGIFEIVADASGRVVDLAVGAGDLVREGQVVARMAQPEVGDRVQQARTQLAGRRAEHADVMTNGAREVELETIYLDQQARALEQSIASAQAALANASIPPREGTADRLRAERNELAQLGVKRQLLRAKHERELQRAAFALREAEERVAQLERDLTVATEVRSPYTGRIIEIEAEQGAVVARGEPLLTLDLTGRTVAALEAIVYVPARDGKRIKPGMAVQLAPATVRPEEYGYLIGKVTQVSDFPSTSRGMARVLKNKDLVAALSGTGPPHEVHVDIVPDPTTASTYRWSSSKGPPVRILSGTLCTADITFDSRRPVEIVMPFLRASDLR